MEARGRIELPVKVLQTFALPLGDRASPANSLRLHYNHSIIASVPARIHTECEGVFRCSTLSEAPTLSGRYNPVVPTTSASRVLLLSGAALSVAAIVIAGVLLFYGESIGGIDCLLAVATRALWSARAYRLALTTPAFFSSRSLCRTHISAVRRYPLLAQAVTRTLLLVSSKARFARTSAFR